MKKYTTLAIVSLLLIVSCNKSNPGAEEQPGPEKFSSQQIDAFIKETIAVEHKFEWRSASDQMVWSALQESDNILSVGYKPADMSSASLKLDAININDEKWLSAKKEVLNIILAEEKKCGKEVSLNDIIQWEENVLPVIDIHVEGFSTIQKLRASKFVRYAEPMGYEPKEVAGKVNSSSGCGSNIAQPGLVANVDYLTILPASKESWNYQYHKISNAWAKSTGAGVKVFIIDTGCEFDQENLGSAFNQGNSSGRTVEKIVTLPRSTFFGIPTGPVETPDDGCGHGTSMAGACAGPRGIDGAACGVAYNCNLVTCRASSDVFMDESREVKGASDAFTNAANRTDVKIISMSMGKITSSSQLSDAIQYAYGKGKLIFCAAGTSFSWSAGWFGVIFPANMSQVNAVTGVKDNNFNSSCADCHNGSETDFTVVMEKASNGRTPLSLAMTGDAPSTVGGSSVSTATTAGIAALVWSRFPSYTREQVLTRLIQSSANYPTRNSSLGWGNINADAATN
ncbi:MAG: S8/S53 family peptidase [Ferruginibacter sp.]